MATIMKNYRRRIQNFFSGTIFNRHRAMIESGKVECNLSNIYFFLPSITDRSEDINQYLNNVSISLVVVMQSQLNNWAGPKFDPSRFDLFGLEKNRMADAVAKSLKHINNISNSNIVQNADLLSRKEVEVPVDWTGENKKSVPPQKCKVDYWLFCFRYPL